MQKKILIATVRIDDFERLEEILKPFLDGGGEILFVQSRQEALVLAKELKPQLLLVDQSLVGNKKEWAQSALVLIGEKEHATAGPDYLERPLQADQVLERCRKVLGMTTPQHPPAM